MALRLQTLLLFLQNGALHSGGVWWAILTVWRTAKTSMSRDDSFSFLGPRCRRPSNPLIRRRLYADIRTTTLQAIDVYAVWQVLYSFVQPVPVEIVSHMNKRCLRLKLMNGCSTTDGTTATKAIERKMILTYYLFISGVLTACVARGCNGVATGLKHQTQCSVEFFSCEAAA